MMFDNKVILITGASSGIGAETAIYLSTLGATLALTGRNEVNLKSVAEKCSNSSTNRLTIVADMSKDDEVKNIIDETIKTFGKLDILVNNAGILEMGSIENTDVQQFDRIMNTNVRSMYHLTYLAVPHLIKTKGNIVNVSSVNGLRAFAGLLSYNLSKAAIDQFTRCVALELAPKQVRVNSVNPGVIITDIHRRAGLQDDQYEALLERSKIIHALGRPGQPIEVATVIAFLASEYASFITGACLPVDGGRHAMCPR